MIDDDDQAERAVVSRVDHLAVARSFHDRARRHTDIDPGVERAVPIDRMDAPDYQRAKVAVEVVEPLGSEQFVYLRSGNQEFTSRMPSRTQLTPGNNVDVVFDTDKMHVFDKQTEMALG